MIVETLQGWIDADRKHTALKPCRAWSGSRLPRRRLHRTGLSGWKRYGAGTSGHALAVYSSGSVPAQKLLFAHTEGDLTGLLGLVRYHRRRQAQADSYARIAEALAVAPGGILFLSDGRRTRCRARCGHADHADRPVRGLPEPRDGNAANGHPRVERFTDIDLAAIRCRPPTQGDALYLRHRVVGIAGPADHADRRHPPFSAGDLLRGGHDGRAAADRMVAGDAEARWRRHPRAGALVPGLFGYHALFLIALKRAPVIEANLINYLWPLLIVLFAALLPGARLRPGQLLGTLLGLSACVLLVTRGGGVELRQEHVAGYLAAGAAAVIWAGYSVLNRRFAAVPAAAIVPACLGVALLGALVHLLTEPSVVPDFRQSLALIGMGLGPLGAAFWLWDRGTKHGDIGLLDGLSYLARCCRPLLVASGRA